MDACKVENFIFVQTKLSGDFQGQLPHIGPDWGKNKKNKNENKEKLMAKEDKARIVMERKI